MKKLRKRLQNVISRPYNGSKLGFIPGTFDNVNQLLALVKRTAGLPHFSFREIRNSGKYEILLGKHEGITFLSKEIPSVLGFDGVHDGNGIHIGYKMNKTADNLMKSGETKAYYDELPADLLAGKHLIFLYANIIEYQYVGVPKHLFYESLIQNSVYKTVVCAKLSQHIE